MALVEFNSVTNTKVLLNLSVGPNWSDVLKANFSERIKVVLSQLFSSLSFRLNYSASSHLVT